MAVLTNPLVSIIIPCYNAAPWITEAIESCLRQTYQPIEIIVVNDGSTDDSLAVIRSFGDRITYMTGPNRGACFARNRGFEMSRGEYVMFLDADDLISAETISVLVQALEGKDNYIATCHWVYLKERGSTWVTSRPLRVPRNFDGIQAELSGYYAPSGSMLFSREVVAAVGAWDESLTSYDDVDLKLRCFLNDAQFIRIIDGKFYYRLHTSPSVSKNRSEKAFRSQLSVLEKIEAMMLQKGNLETYQLTLAEAYQRLARATMAYYPLLAQECEQYAFRLVPRRLPESSTRLHRLACRIIGEQRKEQLAQALMKYGIGRSQRKIFYQPKRER